jgi:hypothetical protein
MPDTLPIQKKRPKVEKQLAINHSPSRQSSWTPIDGASSSSTKSSPNPTDPGSITVEFRLGLEPEDLKEKDLIVLKRPSGKVAIVQHAATGLVMARKVCAQVSEDCVSVTEITNAV